MHNLRAFPNLWQWWANPILSALRCREAYDESNAAEVTGIEILTIGFLVSLNPKPKFSGLLEARAFGSPVSSFGPSGSD